MKRYFAVFAISMLASIIWVGQGCQKFEAVQQTSLTSQNTPFQCMNPEAQSSQDIRRLSKLEYANTVRGLLGEEIYSKLKTVIDSIPDDSLKHSLSDFENSVDASQLSSFESVAKSAYVLLSGNSAYAQQLGGDCITGSAPSADCIHQFIGEAGYKAFRRPLTRTEVADLKAQVYDLGANSLEGVGWTIYRLMLSPEFLYHFEDGGEEGATAVELQLTPHEVASRLSYLLWDAPPDLELYQAADEGQLKTEEQISQQVERMLKDERAKAKLRRFFAYYVEPQFYHDSNYNATFLDTITNLSAINEELKRELYEFVDHIVWEKKGSFQDLLTSKVSFVREPAAAAIYGHEPAAEGESAQMGAGRLGLLMRAPVLSNESVETRPILRGVKFRERFLCDDLGFPSGVALGDAFSSDDERAQYSTREMTAEMTKDTSCMGCHAMINPLGFAFENIDSIGRIRQTDKVFSSDGSMILAEHPVDTSVTGLRIEAEGASEAQDGVELISHMAASDKAPACFARQMYRFYNFKKEQPEDACRLVEMYGALHEPVNPDASILDALKEMIVNQHIMVRKL